MNSAHSVLLHHAALIPFIFHFLFFNRDWTFDRVNPNRGQFDTEDSDLNFDIADTLKLADRRQHRPNQFARPFRQSAKTHCYTLSVCVTAHRI